MNREATIEDLGRFSGKSDQDVINACLEGNGEAWEALVRRYRKLVYSIPFKFGIGREDAMELFQSVWLDCFQELRALRKTDSLRAWLIRIAVRKCYRFKDTLRRRMELPLPDSAEDSALTENPSPELIQRLHQEQLIRTVMAKLGRRCQQVLQALFFEDPLPSYAALAFRLGLSENSIGFTRDRCLDRMGKLLEQLGYEN